MKYTFVFIVIALFMVSVAYSNDPAVDLPGLQRPTDLIISEEIIYVMDGAMIKTFNHKGESLFAFARKGEGPGEIKSGPFYTNSISLHEGNIVIDSLDKLITYSPRGKYIGEKRKGRFLALQVKPVGDAYLVKRVDRSDKKTEWITLEIYDSSMKKLKEIARQRSNIQFSSVQMIPDSPHFCIIGDRIYVERSDKGSVVEIFNSRGEKKGALHVKLKPGAVHEEDKRNSMERYRNDSLVKQIGFENLRKRIQFDFPENFPAFSDILQHNGRPVVKTFHQKKGKIQYLHLDSKGNILNDWMLPVTWEGEMISHLNGVEPKLYTFHNKSFYYLLENPESEEFELHKRNI